MLAPKPITWAGIFFFGRALGWKPGQETVSAGIRSGSSKATGRAP
jgi:hypothetical protein